LSFYFLPKVIIKKQSQNEKSVFLIKPEKKIADKTKFMPNNTIFPDLYTKKCTFTALDVSLYAALPLSFFVSKFGCFSFRRK